MATVAAVYTVAPFVRNVEDFLQSLMPRQPADKTARSRAEAVLKLRALRASGDFDAYWDFHEAREYERNHAQRYADGIAPPVTEPPPPPTSPRLRRVK